MGWYYVLNGVTEGPATEADIRSFLENRYLTLDTLVWTEGMPEWLPYQKSTLCRRVGRWPIAPMRHRYGANTATASGTMKNSVMLMPGAAYRDPTA